MNRREFIKQTAGVVAAALAAPGLTAAQAPKFTAATMRVLGKTGVQCSLLGMGTGVKAWGGNSSLTRKGHDAFIALLDHAYAQGIRYFDMADMYGAHPYMKEVLAKGSVVRDKVTLLTKTVAREPNSVKNDLERFRKDLGTDRLDIVLLHCLTDPDWPAKLKGCMDVLEDAKAKGLVRAHGVSCHSVEALRRAAETPWVDVILARINPFDVKMDAPHEVVAPVLQKAHDNGKGVLGMKIVGEGECRDQIAMSIRYVLGLGCVDAMPIGFLDPAEVDSAITHITNV
jgi:aryl-alcohol dehydrogenase-like predicted oxidoreductase